MATPPTGLWFVLMKPRLRWLAWIIGGAILVAVVLYVLAYGVLSYEAHRAKAFLNEIAVVQLGQPESSLRSLLNRYENRKYEEAASAPPSEHILGIDPWRRHEIRPEWMNTLYWWVLESCSDLRRGIGLRIWEARGVIVVKNGTVNSISVTVFVEGQNEWLGGQWNRVSAVSADLLQHYEELGLLKPEMKRYLVEWSHLHMGSESGEVIRNMVAPDAMEEEQQASRDFNLSCLSSFRGCSSLCELMPAANRYRYAHGYPGLGWNSGSWGQQDETCR